MAVGVGGLITDLMMGNPSAQLGKALAPPNPSPSPTGAPGQAPNPTAQQPGQAPAQTYAPDPQNASTIDLLLKVHRQDAISADLNRNLAGIAAGFGTAQQQHDKNEALNSMQGDDTLAALGQAQKIQGTAREQGEHDKFMAGADIMGQTILHLQPGQGAWLAAGGKLQDIMANHFREMEPTDAIKNYNQARDEMRRQGMTDEQINQIMPPEMLTLGAGADISQRQYTIEKANAARNGQTDFPNFEEWKANNVQTATDTKAAQKFALQLPGLNTQLDVMDKKVGGLMDDKTAMKSILTSANKRTIAKQIFDWDGKGQDPAIYAKNTKALTDDEIKFVNDARQLHLQNYAANFKDAGTNQRLSQQEAARLGQSADQLGNFSADPDTYMERLNDVRDRIGRTRATGHGEARDLDNLPMQYRPKLDPSFIDGPNAVKNRPKWAIPANVETKADIDALPQGQAYKYNGKIYFKGMEAEAD